MVRKYFSNTVVNQVGCCMMSQVKRQVGWNGSRKPFFALYSRFGETIVSVVTISASNPLFFARSISWYDSSRRFQTYSWNQRRKFASFAIFSIAVIAPVARVNGI